MKEFIELIIAIVALIIGPSVLALFGIYPNKYAEAINKARSDNSKKYEDSLYKEAAKSNKDKFNIMTYLLIIIFVMIFSELFILSLIIEAWGQAVTKAITSIPVTINPQLFDGLTCLFILTINVLLFLFFSKQNAIVLLINNFN